MKKILLLSTIVLSTFAITNVQAEINTDVIDEAWGKPTLTYGAGLSDEQAKQTNKMFGIKNSNNVNKEVVYGDDLENYLGFPETNDASLFSSALVQKRAKGGVVVKVLDNIEKISKDEYRNAAITAGATDVEIEIGSVVPVTGESALAGVYKALEANGEELDTARTTIANEELNIVDGINEANKDNENYKTALLNNALIDIKTKLAEQAQNNQQANDDQVESIVNEALKANQLNEILSSDDIYKLISFAKSYQNTSAVTDQATLDQLNNFKEEIKNKVSETLDELNNVGFLDKVGRWFDSLFNTIKSYFK